MQASLPRIQRMAIRAAGPDSPLSSAASSPSVPFSSMDDGSPYASPSGYHIPPSAFDASHPTTPMGGSAAHMSNGYGLGGPRTPSRTVRNHSSGGHSMAEGPGTPGGSGSVLETVAMEDLQPCLHPEADLEAVLQVGKHLSINQSAIGSLSQIPGTPTLLAIGD